ncbi:uncharacterized protein LOC112638910 [Camponotus floridanus]|uniref:uncharacterized protein LOC112638910 n=1 Tax=Camponotus floridanus TaxID=104421 RepID=UPI000DC696F7|nr:uncharacterized protein LOC112638910 [Camponotus floridanus]
MIDTGRDKQRKRHKRRVLWWIKYCTLENDKAQCRFCDLFYYITIYKNHYENHVAMDHNKIYDEIDKKKNWIWQYFSFENNNALCALCAHKNYFPVNLEVSSIRKHLNAKHKDEMKETHDDESGQGIHDNAETIIKSSLASLINDFLTFINAEPIQNHEIVDGADSETDVEANATSDNY